MSYPNDILSMPSLDEEDVDDEEYRTPPEYRFPVIPELLCPCPMVKQAIDRLSEMFQEFAAREEAEDVEILRWHPDQTAGALRKELLGLLQLRTSFALISSFETTCGLCLSAVR